MMIDNLRVMCVNYLCESCYCIKLAITDAESAFCVDIVSWVETYIESKEIKGLATEDAQK